MLSIIIGILEQGFIFGIMALGVYISYSILDFPDLSVDGTFPLGAAVSAAMITARINPWLALFVSFLAGGTAGAVTGILHVKLKITDLLSGILMMTALYSINYCIAGSPNIFFMGENTIFTSFSKITGQIPDVYSRLILIVLLAVAAKFALDWYLSTKSGFLLRSVGSNEGLVVALAQNPGKIKIIGLAIANALVSFAGAINCQRFTQFDVSSGVGTIVMGLAAVIIGTTVFRKVSFLRVTTGVFFGMIIYKACITIAINSGLNASYMNLVITVLFVLTLLINNVINKDKKAKGGAAGVRAK